MEAHAAVQPRLKASLQVPAPLDTPPKVEGSLGGQGFSFDDIHHEYEEVIVRMHDYLRGKKYRFVRCKFEGQAISKLH